MSSLKGSLTLRSPALSSVGANSGDRGAAIASSMAACRSACRASPSGAAKTMFSTAPCSDANWTRSGRSPSAYPTPGSRIRLAAIPDGHDEKDEEGRIATQPRMIRQVHRADSCPPANPPDERRSCAALRSHRARPRPSSRLRLLGLPSCPSPSSFPDTKDPCRAWNSPHRRAAQVTVTGGPATTPDTPQASRQAPESGPEADVGVRAARTVCSSTPRQQTCTACVPRRASSQGWRQDAAAKHTARRPWARYGAHRQGPRGRPSRRYTRRPGRTGRDGGDDLLRGSA